MIQPVTRDRNNDSEVIMMDMSEVNVIQIEDGAVAFNTDRGRFYPLVPSLSMYKKHLESIGFHRLDRTNLVNMRRVRSFDEKRGMVYFDESPNVSSLSATVAFMNIGKLKKFIRGWIDRNKRE
ncbi:LytTR family transcriptional regulator DNA-binding domain-containing protein [Paenibacillaceae bacterium WGS1546]|uniref:LytTR family transcriptional regulator DNA-binding domain-containing protein n=1 Tax=Cohnella sp. WGS1546 TaxID=3366810 RepID=UPI00372D791F